MEAESYDTLLSVIFFGYNGVIKANFYKSYPSVRYHKLILSVCIYVGLLFPLATIKGNIENEGFAMVLDPSDPNNRGWANRPSNSIIFLVLYIQCLILEYAKEKS